MKYNKEDLVDIVSNIVNMLDNNMDYVDYIGESFENWCENGNIFENEEVSKERVESRKWLMKQVSCEVDNLTNKLLSLYENLEE